MLEVACPNCPYKTRVPESAIGRSAKCPKCQKSFVLTAIVVHDTRPEPIKQLPLSSPPPLPSPEINDETKRASESVNERTVASTNMPSAKTNMPTFQTRSSTVRYSSKLDFPRYPLLVVVSALLTGTAALATIIGGLVAIGLMSGMTPLQQPIGIAAGIGVILFIAYYVLILLFISQFLSLVLNVAQDIRALRIRFDDNHDKHDSSNSEPTETKEVASMRF